MNSDLPVPAVLPPRHPILRILMSFPIACFCGALVTDIVYALTADMIWADFSAWLLAVGIIFGVLAAIAGIAALVADRRRAIRPLRPVWPVAIGGMIVLLLALLDNLVHSRDAWTSVMPEGLVVSAITVIAIVITVWLAPGPGYPRPLAVDYVGVRR